MDNNIILGIESSCDDTSAAIICNGYILSNIVSNQTVHKKYGGVVPEIASRKHQKNIVPVVDIAIKEAKINLVCTKAIEPNSGVAILIKINALPQIAPRKINNAQYLNSIINKNPQMFGGL